MAQSGGAVDTGAVTARRPLVIAFDVVETLFPLEPLRARITGAGQPGAVLELWFARLLRDAFALTAGGGYRPFADVAAGALASASGHVLSGGAVHSIVAGFAELDPHPEVEAALRLAGRGGVRVVALTNGSAATTHTLLQRSGLDDHVQRVVAVEEVRRWKPAPEVYLHAARVCGVDPGEVALVAAHGWDIDGARRAGLVTGWVSRLEGRFPEVFARPDVTGDDLVAVVEALLALDPA